jgi:hypothetical protein
MRHHPAIPDQPRRHRGVGIFAVLICVSLSSILITAAAVTFRASYDSINGIQHRGQILNAARNSLHQIAADIRAADSARPHDPTATIAVDELLQFNAQTVPGHPTPGLPSAGGTGVLGIQLVKTQADARDPSATPESPVIIHYWLDTTDQKIYMTRKIGNTTPTPHAVCSLVSSLQIYMQPLIIPANPQSKASPSIVCGRVVVRLSLATHDENGHRILPDSAQNLVLTFTHSAIPRKSLPAF